MSFEQQLKELLLEAGLTEPEAIVYQEVLREPALSVWSLIKRTRLNKNHVYRAFDRLKALSMVRKDKSGITALSLDTLTKVVALRGRTDQRLAKKLKNVTPILDVPTEAVDDFKVVTSKSEILDLYIMMSQLRYSTCLDFGDLEGFVPVLGGMDPVFRFRENRYGIGAKNRAICTTLGPYTQCMLRKNDMNKFQSNIERLKVDYKGKWIIFSDTDDRMMFNDFSDPDAPTSVLVKSKVIADSQRMQFDKFYGNLEKF